jgi:hypothetical protein
LCKEAPVAAARHEYDLHERHIHTSSSIQI